MKEREPINRETPSFLEQRAKAIGAHAVMLTAQTTMSAAIREMAIEADKVMRPLWEKYFGPQDYPGVDPMFFSSGILTENWNPNKVMLFPLRGVDDQIATEFEKDATAAMKFPVGVYRGY